MTKLLVFSDSHCRNSLDMLSIIEEEQPDAVLHLGDMVSDVEDIRSVFPELTVHQVCGNNDWGSDVPEMLVVRVEQVRIFMTHGHLHQVRRNTVKLAAAAREHHCNAALYGHTHEAEIHREGDILVANPGSIGMPYFSPASYLRLTVSGNQITPELIYLPKESNR